MSTSSVAVIIPCYNAARFIRKTLDSVLSQDYEPIEIIAIDDGSTDETKEILKDYSSYVKLFFHPDSANLGQAASLNLGIKNTKADLIAFLDSDDKWYPKKIEKQVKIFKKHSDVGVVYTNGHAIDEKDNILYTLFSPSFKEENIRGKILLDCYISAGASTVMVRKKHLQSVGLFQPELHSMDHDMWIKLSEITNFYYLPEKLMAYRRHSGQKSSKREQWESGFRILKNACKRYPYDKNIIRKRYAVLYFRLG